LGSGDVAAEGYGELVLVVDGLGGAFDELPGVEGGIAEEVCDAAVVLQTAGLHGEVLGAGAGELGRWRAGDHLHLVYGIHGDGLRYETVITLLANGFCRETVEIELAEVVAGAADDGKTSGDVSTLRAGRQSAEGRRIALRIVHDEREIRVG